MTQKYLSFGYDTERPYGDLALSIAGSDLRKRQIDFIRKLNSVFDQNEVSRTFFILGHYIEACLNNYTIDYLREIYDRNNPLVEIQQHSYSHQLFRSIRGREDKQVLTPQEFAEDLQRARDTIKKILNVNPDGLRTPVGYPRNLMDMPEILEALEKTGIRYVSSYLRSEESLEGPVDKSRQPLDYGNVGFPNIIEIPSHGWQDVVFTKEKSKIFLGREPDSLEKIVDHYEDLLSKANTMNLPFVNIALCLHPWAVMEYDPELEFHKHLIGSARSKGYQIITYGQVADTYQSHIARVTTK